MSEGKGCYRSVYDKEGFYICVANHIINLSGLSRASKYSFVEENDKKKWWIQMIYDGSPELNITLESEKEWLDAFDSMTAALCCY